MAAKILIKRQWLEGQAGEIFSLLNKLRTTARNQQGYITGETLQEHNNPQKTLVIGTWEHIQNWFPWKKTQNEGSGRRCWKSIRKVPLSTGSMFRFRNESTHQKSETAPK